MLKMELQINKVNNKLNVMSDIIVYDMHEGEGFESNQTQESHPHLFNLSFTADTFNDLNEVFLRLDQISSIHDKYEKGIEVKIDNQLFAKRESKESDIVYNDLFPKELTSKYSTELEHKKRRTKKNRMQ